MRQNADAGSTLALRLAIVTSHPIQYNAPLFRAIAARVDTTVFFAHRATPLQQASAGFGTSFDWDIDLLAGYRHEFLTNVSGNPGTGHFAGCDTPGIAGKLSRKRFDALLVTGWYLKCFWQAVWRAKRCGIPVVVRGDSHLDTPRSSVKLLMKQVAYPAMLRVFDAGLYVGRRNLEYWLHYRYPRQRLFFSPHCVDNEFFHERATACARAEVRNGFGIPENAPVALFAGKLVPLKRPMDLIEAAAEVRKQGVDLHVLIAGSGELEAPMREAADKLRVAAHFMGFRNQSEMPAAYAAADILVLPSDRETWGLVANEALASGCPLVVSDAVGCAPDLAADPGVGRIFPVGNICALAEAISDLLRIRPEAERIAIQSDRYSVESAARGVVEALDRVIRRSVVAKP